MHSINKIIFLVIFSICSTVSIAQKNYKYHTGSKKAVKLFEQAIDQYDLRKNGLAAKYLEEALQADSNFIEAHTLLGDVYYDLKKYDESVKAYKSAIRIDRNFFPKTYKNLARSELRRMNYKSAIAALQKFMDFPDISERDLLSTKQMYDLAVLRDDLVSNPVPFDPINLGDQVNSIDNEYRPSITADNQTIIFTRRFPRTGQGVSESNFEEEDLYTSVKVDGKWKEARALSSNVNSDGNEGSQCLSPDGKILYFTACDRQSGYGSCDIYYSRKIGSKWSKPMNIGRGINSNYWESQPSISANGKNLYFVSNRPGGKGKQDIWMSVQNENGFWTKAVNLGDSINTKGMEFYPFIHPDNRTLYFSSDGHMGMGSMDILISRRKDGIAWSSPVNIGYPINSPAVEHGLIVSNDGLTGYFASDRLEGSGNLDLYKFDLHEAARPQIVSYIKGVVFDRQSKNPLEAEFEIINLETGEKLIDAKSDKVNGEFLISLPADKEYALNVSKKGYLFYSEHFSSNDAADRNHAYLMDVPLSKASEGQKVILKNIFFGTNSFVLEDRSIPELDKLYSFLENNPSVGIEISGHTDNVGNVNSNQVLSENRAKAVYDFLTKKGSAKERLKYKGYGETQPISDNTTEEGRSLNRRTEFKIISL